MKRPGLYQLICRYHAACLRSIAVTSLAVFILGFGMASDMLADDAASQRNPNVVLVIGDDMTWWDCEPYGSNQVKTPNMAKLAREGISMDYAFTSTAMCAPTRQQLYTGVWPVRNGAYPNHSRVYDGTRSFVHHFQEAGYRVGLAGKSHCKPANCYPWEKVCGPDPMDFDAINSFMIKDESEPFFLVVASNEPHKPWSKGNVEDYPVSSIEVPPTMVDTEYTREQLAIYFAEISYLDWQLGKIDELLEKNQLVDDTILIFTSEQGCQLPFGGKWSCHEAGLRTAMIIRWPGVIEENSRSSAMVQYVDVLPTLLDAIGVDPLAADTGRDGSPSGGRGFDGKSFLEILKGSDVEHREYVFGVHTTRGIINGSDAYAIRSVRSRQFKYIVNLNHDVAFTNIETDPQRDFVLRSWRASGDEGKSRADFYQHRPHVEFYDLAQDPFELKNLADDQDYSDIKAELAQALEDWMSQQGDEGVETELNAGTRQGNRNR